MKELKNMIEGMANRSNIDINRRKTALICVDLLNDGNNDKGFFKQRLGFDISLMQKIEPKVIELIKTCKRYNIPIIGVQAIYDFDYIPTSMRKRFEAMGIKEGGLSLKGSWGSEIIPELKKIGLDLILVKSHYSAFSPGRTFGFRPGNKEVEQYMKISSKEDEKLKSNEIKVMPGYFKEANASKKDIGACLKNNGVVSLDNYLRDKNIDTLIIVGASTHVCIDSTVSGASERGYDIIMPIDAVAAEGIPNEGHLRHFTYLSNQGLFKAELTTTEKIIKNLDGE